MNQKTLICDECLNEFSLKAVGIQYAEVKINDQQLTLIYFACPKCNKIYRFERSVIPNGSQRGP